MHRSKKVSRPSPLEVLSKLKKERIIAGNCVAKDYATKEKKRVKLNCTHLSVAWLAQVLLEAHLSSRRHQNQEINKKSPFPAKIVLLHFTFYSIDDWNFTLEERANFMISIVRNN